MSQEWYVASCGWAHPNGVCPGHPMPMQMEPTTFLTRNDVDRIRRDERERTVQRIRAYVEGLNAINEADARRIDCILEKLDEVER